MINDHHTQQLPLSSYQEKIIDFCHDQALISARIIHKTKAHGISLEDIACIALAIFKNYPILTCDKIWKKPELDVQFIMAR